jgi:c-di-GMP-related signal transduction protein
MERLLALADVVKVDFLATQGAERRAVLERHARPGLTFLAEKAETRQDFEEALAAGYTLFQGYFFCRPQMMSTRRLPSSKLGRLRLLEELARPELDFDRLEHVLKSDMDLSVKVLRYLNSAHFGWHSPVTSIKQALVRLGERQFRHWAALVTLASFGEDQPPELLSMCLTRAHFCERLGQETGAAKRGFELFLCGLLSILDVLLERPMDEALDTLTLAPDVRASLLGDTQSHLGQVLGCVLAYERAQWGQVAGLLEDLGASGVDLQPLYREAVERAERALHP